MRIGLISDIHGNLLALDSVLANLDRLKIDSTVCLGDVTATGPRPHEVLNRLRSRNIPSVMGNRDEYLLNISEEQQSLHKSSGNDYSTRVREIDHWCRSKMSEEDIRYIRNFPDTLSIPIGSKSTESLFCFHGSPKSNTDSITSTTPEDELSLKLAGRENRMTIMIGGHTHVQMFRKLGQSAIINPGSVGQAIEYVGASLHARRIPWADYGIIECNENGALQRIELARSYLEPSEVLRDAVDSGMPHAEWWAERK